MWSKTNTGKRKRFRLETDSDIEAPSMDGGLLEAMMQSSVSSKDNHIYFYSEVNQRSIEQLIKAIREQNCSLGAIALRYDVHPKIYLHINSEGGEIYSAFAAVDSIRNSKIPIVTIVEGCAASAATLLSVAGSERRMLPHSHMLIHQLRSGFWGKMEDIEEELGNLNKLMRMIKDFYSENTKMNKKQLGEVLKHDEIWDSTKCLKTGLIDIVEDGQIV